MEETNIVQLVDECFNKQYPITLTKAVIDYPSGKTLDIVIDELRDTDRDLHVEILRLKGLVEGFATMEDVLNYTTLNFYSKQELANMPFFTIKLADIDRWDSKVGVLYVQEEIAKIDLTKFYTKTESDNKYALKVDLSGKIDNPTGGTAGLFLKKTASGVEWADVAQGSGVSSIAVNNNTYSPGSDGKVTLPNYPDTSNLATKTEVNAKLTTPSGGTNGLVLTKSGSNVVWGNAGGSGEVNVIESIEFNGTEAPITNKKASITFTESDPVFNNSVAKNITLAMVNSWNTAGKAIFISSNTNIASSSISNDGTEKHYITIPGNTLTFTWESNEQCYVNGELLSGTPWSLPIESGKSSECNIVKDSNNHIFIRTL